jgi:GT2 family glycosyltransferase/glycosyltransferase involved in cell wall biosynthesis
VPQFVGHDQPQLPIDVGFYDLRNVETIRRQVELARQFGVSVFCFHYYWFGGKRLLERPLNLFIQNKDLDLKFCLCWANENWTRRWDGQEQDILIAQQHSPDDDINVLKDLFTYVNDARYLRIDGKPLIIVYRFKLFPDAAATIRRWRKWARDNGHGELFIVGAQTWGEVLSEHYGVDAVVEFPPHGVMPLKPCSDLQVTNPNFTGVIYDYPSIPREKRYLTSSGRPTFKTAFPGWDNTARRSDRGSIFHGSKPALYREWLKDLIVHTRTHNPPHMQYVFINAWNEWAEGAHLEPDRRLGYGNLVATAEAILEARESASGIRDLTRSKHGSLYNARWRRLERLFRGRINHGAYQFLADYEGVLSSIYSRHPDRVSFAVESAVPVCRVGGEVIEVSSRGAIAKVSQAVDKMNAVPSFGFVVLQYNKPELSLQCVNSIKALASPRFHIHIVVVDNGSSSETVEKSRKFFSADPLVSLVLLETNAGFARGNNAGYKFCRETLGSDFIVILNNDTIIEDTNFLPRCRELFDEWGYSLLGPDIVLPSGGHQNPWNDYVYTQQEWSELAGAYRRNRKDFAAGKGARFPIPAVHSDAFPTVLNPILHGACIIASPLFIRRHEIVFDPRTFLYGEEFLQATNALIDGELLLYSQSLQILHNESSSTAQIPSEARMMMGYDNALHALALVENKLRCALGLHSSAESTIESIEVASALNPQKKNILVDLLFCQGGYHGGGEYGKSIFRSLVQRLETASADIDIWAAVHPGMHLDRWVWDLCKEHHVRLIKVESFDEIVEVVDTEMFESFFTPAIVVYTGYEYWVKAGGELKFNANKTRIVGCLHDIRDLEFCLDAERVRKHQKALGCGSHSLNPLHGQSHDSLCTSEYAEQLRKMYRSIICSPSAKHLVTPSSYCRESMLRHLGGEAARVHVLYSPLKPNLTPQQRRSCELIGNEEKFALFVNGAREEKNAAAAIRAFEKIFASQAVDSGLKLVITGLPYFEAIGLSDISNKDRFILLPQVEAADLEDLLQRALFLIYPSLGEGFGYPPLEAMKYGTPSIASRTSSIPEIYGDAVVYCDPFNIDSIVDAVIEILDNGIDPSRLQKRYHEIRSRQDRDTQVLLDLILHGSSISRNEASITQCIASA